MKQQLNRWMYLPALLALAVLYGQTHAFEHLHHHDDEESECVVCAHFDHPPTAAEVPDPKFKLGFGPPRQDHPRLESKHSNNNHHPFAPRDPPVLGS